MISHSDLVWDKYNRLYDAKLNGSLKNDELSELMILVGESFVSNIKQGKTEEDEVRSFQDYVSGFTKENKDNYFNFKHADLDRAAKIIINDSDYAKEDRAKYSQTVENPNYTKGFRKLM